MDKRVESDCLSQGVNTLKNGINQNILPQAIGK